MLMLGEGERARAFPGPADSILARWETW